ncbi:ATP-dependent nuclease [Marinobacter sp. LV10MA510-1]|uniref:ATP-dependent nuclease n=1 Tax=Marinobacter sp. LV10MA510-1 TaxID=1415567 RepID=UPI000BF4FE32|nr:AAA family ATPase [Marinobacter sp. LV10MA510-1]PFG11114.1 putative ATP-dependent endonuclease of OLD family [Marinobacter sp. LV10MA510-1]
MFLESVSLMSFRCFGPNAQLIHLSSGLTTFVGLNGSGKTAVMQALQRLFGVTGDQRRLRRQDFHIPSNEKTAPSERSLIVEVILAFPELSSTKDDATAVPEFFQQMAADEHGNLKCRLRLEATWIDDGSLDGTIEQRYFAVRKFGPFEDSDCTEVKATDRSRIQMLYVPASRDGASQVTAFLRGRLWRAVNWSDDVRSAFFEAGSTVNEAFTGEVAVDTVALAVKKRWQEVHSAGTDTTPLFRPIDLRFQEFIRKVEVVFYPDEEGRERALDDLSDGQRSLFHLAMTAATLDVEAKIANDPAKAGFQPGGIHLPALTLIAVEEPENNLAPFYLSRIVKQIEDLTGGNHAQAVLSSHSASILARVDPSHVRHFRLKSPERTALVKAITLPDDQEDAAKFLREAVRSYPELYFARFAVLGEGASEEIVIPRISQAMGCDIDRSFVAVVPLGGRHVNHLWRLLADLDIPHATLLDLDWGREGGGWGRIKNTCSQLLKIGRTPQQLFRTPSPDGPAQDLATFDTRSPSDIKGMREWLNFLQSHNVFFSAPLDLDYSMLRSFRAHYQVVEEGRNGPSTKGDPRSAVLGDEGDGNLYEANQDEFLRWYRYLFLGRGKPSTHVRVMSSISQDELATKAPDELRALIELVAKNIDNQRLP